MAQTVSNDVADRVRGFAWRIRPLLGRDDDADAARNGGRGLGDTIAMVIAAGHRTRLTGGTDKVFRKLDLAPHEDAIRHLRRCLHDGIRSGAAGDAAGFMEIAPGVHAWVSDDGTVVTGALQQGMLHEQCIAIREDGGEWTMHVRTPVPEAERKAITTRIATALDDLLGPVSGKVNSMCCPGGIIVNIDRRVDKRPGKDLKGDQIGELAIRYDRSTLDATIDSIVHEVRTAHRAHQERLARLRGIRDRIEQVMLAKGYHTRVDFEDCGDTWNLHATHLGANIAGILFGIVSPRSIEQVEKQLEVALDRAETGRLGSLSRMHPNTVDLGRSEIDATLLLMARSLAPEDGDDTALRRIVAHGERKWSAQDLSDLFGTTITATAAIDIQPDRKVRAIVQLSPDITIKRGTLVIRRQQLPQTVLGVIQGMKVRALIEHPWMPDANVERVTASAGIVGETYSLVLTPAYGRASDMKLAA